MLNLVIVLNLKLVSEKLELLESKLIDFYRQDLTKLKKSFALKETLLNKEVLSNLAEILFARRSKLAKNLIFWIRMIT